MINSCYLFKDLKNFLDSWIFKVLLDKIFNKICRLIYIMYILTNYSHEYKTRRILDLDKILLLPSCRNVNCFINNCLIFCYSHIYSMRYSIYIYIYICSDILFLMNNHISCFLSPYKLICYLDIFHYMYPIFRFHCLSSLILPIMQYLFSISCRKFHVYKMKSCKYIDFRLQRTFADI